MRNGAITFSIPASAQVFLPEGANKIDVGTLAAGVQIPTSIDGTKTAAQTNTLREGWLG